jgi:hypothetical protein
MVFIDEELYEILEAQLGKAGIPCDFAGVNQPAS